jgi:hypothetical protein
MGAYNPVNRVAEYTQEGKQLMDDYPVAAVGVAFGLGLATGLAIASMLTEPQQRSRHWDVANRLGEQLLDAMSTVLPDALSKPLRR